MTTTVKFIKRLGTYQKGQVKKLTDAVARVLIVKGVAEEVVEQNSFRKPEKKPATGGFVPNNFTGGLVGEKVSEQTITTEQAKALGIKTETETKEIDTASDEPGDTKPTDSGADGEISKAPEKDNSVTEKVTEEKTEIKKDDDEQPRRGRGRPPRNADDKAITPKG